MAPADIYKITKKKANVFRKGLYAWASNHPRPMPWKGESDPYKIWISEIILQQTRVAQGLPYFENFIRHFPTIQHLANASIEEVLKLWEGLGYYTRARNLHFTAQFISNTLDGKFPEDYDEIIKLKGIGAYTAAAIASFAFHLPYAVLDGNVHRILSRYLGINQLMQTSDQKKYFQLISQSLLDVKDPADYNQSIMDFGAMCCTPANPKCEICPLQNTCYAYEQDQVAQLPPAKLSKAKKIRYFHYFILLQTGRIAIHQRQRGDIWTGLYEFPLVETKNSKFPSVLKHHPLYTLIKKPVSPILKASQVLTHQIIHAYFYCIKVKSSLQHGQWISLDKLNHWPMPGIIAKKRKVIQDLVKKN